MLVWHLCQDSGHSLQETAGQHIAAAHIHSPDKHGREEKVKEKRDANNDKTSQKPGAESSHETVSYRPLHQHTAQLDLYTHMIPNLRLGMGKSHSSPNVTAASCINHSLVKVSMLVSSTTLVQENRKNRRKKLCMKTALSVISARKTKDHYRCQMGIISFSRNIAI